MPSNFAKNTYRADIDGLRAIAITLVVIYHAFPDLLPSGFIGVDIFFVISGYLIASIVFRGLNRGEFKIGDFYSRRIRRIFPALAIVLCFCLIFGWATLLFEEYEQLGKHILASALFLPNIFSWQESGYFAAEAELQPLLHLWSIGVEEQFYIVMPLLLLITWKLRLKPMGFILISIAASFTLSVMEVTQNPDAAFYLPQYRFWELLVGVMLACWDKPIPTLSNVSASLGVALIATGLLVIDSESSFPGVYAILPCLGAALIIYAGEQAWLNRRLFSNKALVWIGLISYPLYLWHWPLLSFMRIIEGGELPAAFRLFLVALAILLAWGTYNLVERPIRFGEKQGEKTAGLSILMLFIAFCGMMVFLKAGIPERSAAQPLVVFSGDIGHAKFHRYIKQNFYRCTPDKLYSEALQWGSARRCYQSQNSKTVEVALIGDSHAEHFFIGLAESFPEKNIAYYVKEGFPTLENDGFDGILKHIMSSTDIHTVVVAARWNRAKATSKIGITQLVDRLSSANKSVVFLGAIPTFEFHADKCKFKRRFRQHHHCSQPENTDEFISKSVLFNQLISELEDDYSQLRIRHTENDLCENSTCSMTKGEEILFRDNNHLNIKGSKYVGNQLKERYPDLLD